MVNLNKDARNLAVFLMLVMLTAGFTGCAGITPPSPDDLLRSPTGDGPIQIGMTKNEVESIWGKPDEVRTIEDPKRWDGPRELWVYRAEYGAVPVNVGYLSKSKRLYFDGVHLTNIGD